MNEIPKINITLETVKVKAKATKLDCKWSPVSVKDVKCYMTKKTHKQIYNQARKDFYIDYYIPSVIKINEIIDVAEHTVYILKYKKKYYDIWFIKNEIQKNEADFQLFKNSMSKMFQIKFNDFEIIHIINEIIKRN